MMNSIRSFLLFVLFLGSMHLQFSSLGQNLQSVMKKVEQAHQQEFWDQLHTVFAKGQWYSEHGWLNVEILIKKPNRFLVRNLNMKMAESFDGSRAWTWGPWTEYKIEEMDSEQGLKMANIFFFGSPLKDLDSLIYQGEVEVDQVPCYWVDHVKLNQRTEYFFEKETSRLYKSILTDRWDRKHRIVTRTVLKYRKIQGIDIPTVILVKTENHEDEYVLEKIVLGDNIRDDIFRKSNSP